MTPQEEQEIFQEALSSGATRRVLWQILEAGGIYRTTLVLDNAVATAYNEGRRSIALELLQRLEGHCPGSLEQMKAEEKYYAEVANPALSRRKRRSLGRDTAVRPRTGSSSGGPLATLAAAGTDTDDDPADFDPYAIPDIEPGDDAAA